MVSITFRGKPETIYNVDGTVAFERIKVPTPTHSHYDMASFRQHPKFGPFANSDLFLKALQGALKSAGVGSYIRLDRVPDAVAIDRSGFLTKITITIP